MPDDARLVAGGKSLRYSWPSASTLPRRLLALLVQAYRLFLRPVLGNRCRYFPTCSEYALEALHVHGAWRGSGLALRRVARCHPFCAGGHDPVPRADVSLNPRTKIRP